MAYTIRQLAELVHGNVVGDPDMVIHAARTLQDAQPGDISFVENDKNAPRLLHSNASAAVVPLSLPLEGRTVIRVADPLTAFVAIFRHFQGKPARKPIGIDPRADVHPSVQIGDEPSIHPYAYLEEGTIIGKRCQIHSGVVVGKNCRLGDDVVLYPKVVLYEEIVLGDRVTIHANAVIGADGFGFRFHQGRHVKVPQLSIVIIGSDVEIGACSTIDRGVFEPTRIGEGTKIDNHVQIAHNVQIGKHNLLSAQTGIGGSSVTGDYVFTGGQVGIRDHMVVGAGAMLGAQCGVLSDVPPNGRMFGCPAQHEREIGRILAVMKKLPEMRKELLVVLKHLGLSEEKDAA